MISDKDGNFQTLWREKPSDELKLFWLNTVTYTVTYSFSNIFSHFDLSDIYKVILPIGSKVVPSDLYVGDVHTGAESYDELIIISNHVTEILTSAGFNLTNCHSKPTEILNS